MMYNLSESHLGSYSASSATTTSGTGMVRLSNNNNNNNNKCLCYYVAVSNKNNAKSLQADDDDDDGLHDHDHDDGGEGSSSHPRCPVCVRRSLQPHLARHAQAMADRDRARDECARQLDTAATLRNDHQHQQYQHPYPPRPHYDRLGELQAESQRLRDRLMNLRKQCADRAVRVASQAVENDLHREATQQLAILSSGGGGGGGGGAGSISSGTDENGEEPQQQLQRLEESLLQGSLHHALNVASNQVRVLRFQWARKAIAMHRLDIDTNDIKMTPLQQRRDSSKGPSSSSSATASSDPRGGAGGALSMARRRRARGIGKIGGLPLPHAGQELYGVLPPKELQSALRLVASVTCTVARCLGIVLPHPILLTPITTTTASSGGANGTATDITDTVSDHELQRRLRESHHATSLVDDGTNYQHQRHHSHSGQQGITTTISTSRSIPHDTPHHQGSSASSSLMSLMDTSYWKRSAKKALARATGSTTTTSSSPNPLTAVPSHFHSSSAPGSLLPSPSSSGSSNMDSSELSLRIHHATAAVLAEDSSPSSSKFALSAEVMHQQDFAIALQLLQNNVIVLCIRAGVPVSQLWPAEAVLLNLYQLDQYCQQQTAVSY